MTIREVEQKVADRLLTKSDKMFEEHSLGNWLQFGSRIPMTPGQIWKIAFSCGVKALLDELTEIK